MTHQIRLPRLVLVLIASVVMAMGMTSLALAADESQAARASASVTWTCTSSPCPSGPLFEGHAAEWPSAMGATNVRLGYTASRPVYAPGAAAKGWTVLVLAGSARVEAGLPQDAVHRQLATLGAGGSYVVGELAPGEVLSVQASSVFMYELAAPTTPSPTSTTTTSSTSSTTTQAPTTTTTQAPTSTTSSTTTTQAPTSTTSSTTTTQAPSPTTSPGTNQVVTGSSSLQTWTCTGSPCPWGPSTTDHALAWPSSMGAQNVRLGYSVSAGIYAPAASVQGWTVTVTSGSARVYAGLPQGSSHRLLASLSTGGSYLVAPLGSGEVVSVQNATAFSWSLTAPAEPTPTPTTTTSTPTTTTTTSTPTTTTTTSTPTTTTPSPTTTVPEPSDPGTVSGSSSLVTWTCTGSPCPWGPTTTDHALVWPAGLGATDVRLGYTASGALYVPGSAVAGATVQVTSGSARVYAGLPQGSSHRLLATLSAGGSYVVGTLGTGEVLSVQNSTAFSWSLTTPTTTTPTPTTTTTTTPTPTPTTTTPPPGVPEGSTASSQVTWTCVSSPCPWGPSTSDHALVWPSTMNPSNVRLGYTASAGVYAPGAAVSGWTVSVPAGSARVYAGLPQGSSHRLLATIVTGGSHVISGLSSGEVVSVQATSAFAWTLTEPVGGPTPTPTGTATPTPTGTTTPPPTTACTDPTTCDPVDWIESRWRCNLPGCTYGDWVGGVISWPSWAAYSDNARSGASSRTVYSVDGDLLHPYMGAWASGCRVTVVSGAALIIEWKRGSDTWRETLVEEGESHVIQLAAGEDGAMIETPNNVEPFSVTLQNCTPQPVDQTSP